MLRIKKLMAVAVIGILVISSANTVKGMTPFYAGSGRDYASVYVAANTTAGQKTYSTDYGLVKGKYVSYVTIRLREGKKYDKSTFSQSGYVKLSKLNNPSATAYGTWKWTYR